MSAIAQYERVSFATRVKQDPLHELKYLMAKKPWIKVEILDAYTYIIGRRKSHNSNFYKVRLEEKKKEEASRSFCSKLMAWGRTLIVFGVVAGVFGPIIYIAAFGDANKAVDSDEASANTQSNFDPNVGFASS